MTTSHFHRSGTFSFSLSQFPKSSPPPSPMESMICTLVLLACSFAHPLRILARPAQAAPSPTSRITVVGAVYCDTCLTDSFSKYSYFLPGADVNIQCKFKASAPATAEQIDFSVNRTTGRYGTYRLDVPSVDGVDCVDGQEIASMCRASLIGSSSSSCDVPGLRATVDEVTVKSKQDNLCIYSMSALSYRPQERNITLCGNKREGMPQDEFNSSKFFLPYFPPYGFPWPPIPQLPPFPSIPPLPPFPSIPFPPLPPCPFPFPSFPFPNPPPPLPFPFPPLPPLSPPGINLTDPRTWIPRIPLYPSPPLPLPPSPPMAYSPFDPRSWIPHLPPYSPPQAQDQAP
ncbi:sulfated surface glycoprotein 185-like isoform X1 [Rhodamnia argentea]|uniref:Sulfated surface glycoprotein 185-like isoform X1 n=1 Tax=Rhodamnia argentea TaxID=178133 RepID=A0A8B8NZK6_9MYRT|nr:sulfated surface glycoprotein 185-like isoform X1 [Rhodamnia argentea]